MKSKLFLALCIAAATVSCGRVSGTTKILGTIEEDGFDEVNIVMEKLQLDTLVPVVDGKFSCEIPTDPTEVGIIAAGYYTAAFIPDGTKLTAVLGPEPSVTSSSKRSAHAQYSAMEQKLIGFNNDFLAEVQKISGREDVDEETAGFLMSELYESAMGSMTDYLEQQVYANNDNAVSAIALASLAGIMGADELTTLIDALTPEMKENTIVASMIDELNIVQSTSEGEMFKDFTIEDSDGKTVSLSDYVGRGKYVLVDFWASWCGPCKEEIPNIRAVYEKYHDKGLVVLSVAVWDDPEDTKVAARENRVTWDQIVNAGTIPGDVYGITGIPHIILFGPDGTILKRGLRGEAIDQELSKYFQ